MAQVYDLLAVYPVGSQSEDEDYASCVSSQSSGTTCTPVPSPAYGAHHVWRTSRLFTSHDMNMERLAQVGPVVKHGWCELVDKATTKRETGVPLASRQGYIQLSFDGLNHVRPVLVGLFTFVTSVHLFVNRWYFCIIWLQSPPRVLFLKGGMKPAIFVTTRCASRSDM